MVSEIGKYILGDLICEKLQTLCMLSPGCPSVRRWHCICVQPRGVTKIYAQCFREVVCVGCVFVVFVVIRYIIIIRLYVSTSGDIIPYTIVN